MVDQIILASKSEVRKKILEKYKINCIVKPSNIDEDSVKESLLKKKATPEIISKNLAELKANKISQKMVGELVLGADSVIDLNGKIISKPINRDEALKMFTKWPSYAVFEEDVKGTIEVGKLADFTIFSKDLMTIPAEEIMSSRNMMTIVSGEVVYSR